MIMEAIHSAMDSTSKKYLSIATVNNDAAGAVPATAENLNPLLRIPITAQTEEPMKKDWHDERTRKKD
jgi:hypothetical protein